MNTLKDVFKRLGKAKTLSVIIAALIITVGLIIIFAGKDTDVANEPVVVNVSTLERVINVNELSTYTTVYNGVARAMNEKKPDKIDYYVAYEASVDAGIDFSKINIRIDDVEKIIYIMLPKVQITDVTVAFESMDFMWVNGKANTSSVSEQAYKLCIADVENESENLTVLLDLAKQNAVKTIEALTKPIIEQADSEYKLMVD